MIPLENGRQDMDLEEERRLFYVGMTRAEDELILITSSDPSPFLADIPEENLLRETTGKQKVRESGKQISFADIL